MEPETELPSNIAEIISRGEAKSWNAIPVRVSPDGGIVLATPSVPPIPLVDDIGHILASKGYHPIFEEITDPDFDDRIDEFYRPFEARVLICKGEVTQCPFSWAALDETDDPRLRRCLSCDHIIELATSRSEIETIRETDHGAAIAHYDDVMYIVHNDPFPTHDD